MKCRITYSKPIKYAIVLKKRLKVDRRPYRVLPGDALQQTIQNKFTANIYHETTMKLQQKYCSLNFTTTDHSILQIVGPLRGNLLQFKVSLSSNSMFLGSWVRFPSLSMTNSSKVYSRFVGLWSKYNVL